MSIPIRGSERVPSRHQISACLYSTAYVTQPTPAPAVFEQFEHCPYDISVVGFMQLHRWNTSPSRPRPRRINIVLSGCESINGRCRRRRQRRRRHGLKVNVDPRHDEDLNKLVTRKQFRKFSGQMIPQDDAQTTS